MKKRREIKPSELGRRRRRRRNVILALCSLLIILVLGGVIGLTHLPQFSINDIKVEGNLFTPTDDIVKTVNENISGNYFYLFSKKNILLFPKDKIRADILNQYSPIQKVSIDRVGLKGLHVAVSERKQEFLWCYEEQCYFLDHSGFIFSPAPDVSKELYFIYYGAVDGENPIGQNYLTPENFTAIVRFGDDVKKLGIEADYIKAMDFENFELHLLTGGRILFNTRAPLDDIISNLQTVTDKNNTSGTSVDLSKIEYLDLRFGNKIIYKLLGGAVATSTKSN